MNKYIAAILILFLLASNAWSGEQLALPGLLEPAQIVRDAEGIAHIRAENDTDLYYLQGWVHAEDRLFQMDLTRRQPSGTLAELFGPVALTGDVEARTIGLRRAAVRSAAALSDKTIAALEAYARGVNDWVMQGPGLPPEYAAVGFPDRQDFRSWNVIDSVVIGKAIAFSLSFDLDTGATQDLAAYVEALGPAGGIVFTQDVFRSQPFDCAATVPDATGKFPFDPLPTPPNPEACPGLPSVTKVNAPNKPVTRTQEAGEMSFSTLVALAEAAENRLRQSEFIRNVLDADGTLGSNEWGIGRGLGANGRPIIANDPHLSLNTPSTFYPMGLEAAGLNVFGSSFPGTAFIVLGYNKHIHWGATTNPMDVTDTFVELLVFDDNGQPAGTLFQGELEPVELVPEEFFFNGGGVLFQAIPGELIPAATIIVPRRNNGPIIQLLTAPTPGAVIPALSIQYTGFSATRELDTFRLWNEARNLKQFRRGLSHFDFGSQNWVYGDNAGNVAYFASAEMPIRADLNQGFVAPGSLPDIFPPGLPIPPWFIRDGTSGEHEWLPVSNLQTGQAVPYEILRQDELPHTINPPAGWFVNANNDPAGTVLDNDPLNQARKRSRGIYYLNAGYAGGFRAGTITSRIRDYVAEQGELSQADLQDIQADVSLLDARFFVPFITNAFASASQDNAPALLAAFAADADVAEAIERLTAWNFNAPTGIQTGYDAGDPVVADWSELPEPDQAEIDSSIAATIYSVWRGQAVRLMVDEPLAGLPGPGSTMAMTAMQHLLRTDGGTGIVDFFAVPGLADFSDQRDFKLLAALRSALDLLAGDAFAPAFANSSNQDDYRWGKLHRIVFDHPFIDGASVPAQPPGAFPQPVPGLAGFPTDGGFNVVDASSHSARADSVNDFMFGGGPVRRYSAEPNSAFSSGAASIWAGGVSGVPFPGNPFYANLLSYWLVNETVPLVLRAQDASPGTTTDVVPAVR
ncbi:MAG: penicillin acylase family protein [Gammaproteobacteria bacterium]|nr:penicillin acylase family protein [Gammaproteobacteria bacterium]NNM19761.1 penicillin acylase family protein [Gammaproteobacteria bacterium]